MGQRPDERHELWYRLLHDDEIVDQHSLCTIDHDDHQLVPKLHKCMCAKTKGAPTRKPIDNLISELVNRKPRLGVGRVWSHEPADGAEHASRRARSDSCDSIRSSCNLFERYSSFHACCMDCRVTLGIDTPLWDSHEPSDDWYMYSKLS